MTPTICVPGFTLAPNSQDESGVNLRYVAVQGEVAVGSRADDQFALSIGDRPADQGVLLQHIQRRNDFLYALCSAIDPVPGQVIENTVKV